MLDFEAKRVCYTANTVPQIGVRINWSVRNTSDSGLILTGRFERSEKRPPDSGLILTGRFERSEKRP